MIDREVFEQLVREGYSKLPEKFRAKIKNVALLVEDEPDDEVRRGEGLAPNETLLGYYRGIPHTVRGADYGVGPTLPDTITLYQKPIEEEAFASDPSLASLQSSPEAKQAFREQVRRVVAETIWHEVAHYFGYEEHEVRRREDERGRGTTP